jgi:hypothetical protein
MTHKGHRDLTASGESKGDFDSPAPAPEGFSTVCGGLLQRFGKIRRPRVGKGVDITRCKVKFETPGTQNGGDMSDGVGTKTSLHPGQQSPVRSSSAYLVHLHVLLLRVFP